MRHFTPAQVQHITHCHQHRAVKQGMKQQAGAVPHVVCDIMHLCELDQYSTIVNFYRSQQTSLTYGVGGGHWKLPVGGKQQPYSSCCQGAQHACKKHCTHDKHR